MYRRALFHLRRVWAVTLILTVPRVAESQATPRVNPAPIPSLTEARVGIAPVSPSRAAGVATDSLTLLAAPMAEGSPRSAALAGAASFLLPGLGSFYASHPTHGLVHMAIHLGAGTLALAGTVSCAIAWGGTTDCEEGGMQVVAAVWLVNWGWAIVTGVNDAKAYNARHAPK